jgi:hypothetical protein
MFVAKVREHGPFPLRPKAETLPFGIEAEGHVFSA